MKVSKLMTSPAGHCSPEDSFADAATLMKGFDCGMIPVVEDGLLVGTVTDRDIALAAASISAPASEIPVSAAASADPVTCRPSEKAEKAVSKMKKKKVRRLPVVDEDGRLVGVISIADILLASKKKKQKDLRKKALSALRSISEPSPIVLTEIA